jgi:hypothetical protein
MMWKKAILFVLTSIVCGVSASVETSGISLPDVMHVNGVQLKRNGHGIRSITFLGMSINVYVAGLYTPKPLLSEEDVYGHRDGPIQMDFTFLRSVGRNKVISAWSQQLEHSVSHSYDGYEKDRDKFIDLFSNHIAYGGTQTVQLVGDNTVIVDQGVHKGDILGRNFQKAFLSMWFGERAVGEDLKENLLDGAAHRQLAAA